MAKMYYTLEEAAEVLGQSEDAVRELASEGKLQQFKDREKLFFKKDEVEALAGGGDAGGSGAIPLADTDLDQSSVGGLSLMDDSGDTKIDGVDDTSIGGSLDLADSAAGQASGVSVFDSDDSGVANPMDQTAVASHGVSEEDLSLEAVGSGSGLLDLTRESDDTSLGAELLDEIYPGGGSETGADFAGDSAIGSSGVFDNSMSLGATGTGSAVVTPLGASGSMASPSPSASGTATGMGMPAGGSVYGAPAAVAGTAAATAVAAPVRGAGVDPVGSGLVAGLLFGSLVALLICLMVVLAKIIGSRSQLLSMFMPEGGNNVWMLTAGLVVLSAIAAVIGVVIARSSAR